MNAEPLRRVGLFLWEDTTTRRTDLLMGVIILTVLAALWASYFSPPDVTYRSLIWPVEQDRVEAGGAVVMDVYRCNDLGDLEAHGTRVLVPVKEPDRYISLGADGTVSGLVPPGCTESNPAVTIPDFVATGDYYVKGQTTHQNRFHRDVTQEWRSSVFRITAQPAGR